MKQIDSTLAADAARMLTARRDGKRPMAHVGLGKGRSAPLPAPAFDLLLEMLEQMARGNVVAITPVEADLTTQQAADLLGMSRPHLVKLLEAGVLPFRLVGSHRRVKLSDVTAYRRGSPSKPETVMKLDSIDDAIRAIEEGEMIVVVDDDDRENEGDLIVAASKVTAQQVAFMVRHTSGILCAPLTAERAHALQLDPMVRDNNAPLQTAFTISVDYREGLTTGIAAEERANTARALANGNVQAQDFVRPGHVFPLIAREGGVLMRSGHTEAATDLAHLAGLPAVGLLGELVNDDGTVKRFPQLVAFAKEHKLKIVSIADLIAYRRARERLVSRVSEFEVATEIGPAKAIAYATVFDSVQHLALTFGDIHRPGAVAVRIHRQEVLADVFGRGRDGDANLISAALQKIKKEGAGVLVYLREGGAGVASPLLDERSSGDGHASAGKRDKQWREVGIGAQILKDLGLTSIKLLTTHRLDYVGVTGFDIKLAETELIGS
jgi:3,4-dihydroxy 2-butanone 4-phosphate synthase / GTP cyclohydrolase II